MESVHIGANVDTSGERVSSSSIPRKQRRSIAEKRRMVEETLAAGASVARVARAHGVNASQVFQWRWSLGWRAAVDEAAARRS
jgi:transposase-like protein